MEKTLNDIENDIASLRANVTKYQALAESHRAADNFLVANRLMQLVADLEAQVAQLEALKANSSPAAS